MTQDLEVILDLETIDNSEILFFLFVRGWYVKGTRSVRGWYVKSTWTRPQTGKRGSHENHSKVTLTASHSINNGFAKSCPHPERYVECHTDRVFSATC